MKIISLMPTGLTVVAFALYFSPWYAPSLPHGGKIYFLSLLWLLVGWIFIPIYCWLAVRARKRGMEDWRWYALSAAFICILSGSAYFAITRGYFLSA